jgi:hypothetical protein
MKHKGLIEDPELRELVVTLGELVEAVTSVAGDAAEVAAVVSHLAEGHASFSLRRACRAWPSARFADENRG